MKLVDFVKLVEGEVVTDIHGILEFENVYIGDLLSVVMSKAKENSVWLTIQTHLNIVAVAELVEFKCIILVEGMKAEKSTVEKANELNIPIIETGKSAYDVSCLIYNLMKDVQ